MLSCFSQLFQFWPPYVKTNSFSSRDTAIFEIFQKFLENLIFKFFLILEFSLCSWVLSAYSQGLRILPPNLSLQILVVFEIWRFLWFFQKFSISLDFKKMQNFEDLNPVVRNCDCFLRGCKSCFWMWLLKSLYFSRFFQNFSENLDI